MLPELNPIELIFLGAFALIVIGPKDLPVVLRKIGQFTARMRGLAAEFRASFDEMARQSELDELRKEVQALRTGQFAQAAAPDLQSHVDEINQHLGTPYWEPAPAYEPPAPVSAAAEGDEVAALPPAAKTTPKPRARKKAGAPASPSDVTGFDKTAADPPEPAAAKAPRRRKAAAAKTPAASAPSEVA
jgi:sec-independent protein translocase protein TatB